MSGLLLEVGEGVTTPLERHYVRDVERAHALPRGSRNQLDVGGGRRRYRDVRYQRWRLVVELDGRAAHPEDEREFDDLRDNEVATRGERTLRYGWRSVTIGSSDRRPSGWRASASRVDGATVDVRAELHGRRGIPIIGWRTGSSVTRTPSDQPVPAPARLPA